MKDRLQIALIQANPTWEDAPANRDYFSEKIGRIAPGTDLVFLPEMFTTGYTMNAAGVAETMQGETLKWMQKMAREKNAALAGSIVIREEGFYYNRLIFVEPSGRYYYYDKRHTFGLAGEDKIYRSGAKRQLIPYKGWKLCPLICYDLRFPVWSRNTDYYDALFYAANWPQTRIAAWDALLQARAIENICYCIGVNRVGVDGNGAEYPGHSAVYNVLGERLLFSTAEETCYTVLEAAHIKQTREKFRFLEDRDTFYW